MQLIKEQITLPATFTQGSEVMALQSALLAKSRAITTVTTAAQNADAGAAVRNLRTHIKGVEAVRVQLTRPLLDGQRLIKALADEHCKPLEDEVRRVEGLGTAYAEAENRRVAAAEAARQATFQRAQQEQFAAEEAARKAAERAKTDAGLAVAIKAEEKAQAAAAKVDSIITAPVPEANRAKGQSLKQVLKWEVTNIRALAAARPDLVRMEPNAAGIQSTCVPNMPNLPPGLKLWWDNKGTYASRSPSPITPITVIEEKPMDYIESQSSQVSKFAHDEQTNTLHVHFRAGGHYSYSGVSKQDYEAFRDAPSHGKHLGTHIKGKFAFQKHS
jgi:hypothetical protein